MFISHNEMNWYWYIVTNQCFSFNYSFKMCLPSSCVHSILFENYYFVSVCSCKNCDYIFLLKFFVDSFFCYYLFQFSFICFDKTKLYFYTMFYILSRIIYIIFIFLFNVFLISTYNIVYTIKKYNIFKQIFFLSFYFGILLEYF